MCEPCNTCESEISVHENACESIMNSTVPLAVENCRKRPSALAEFANQIQFNIAQRAKCNAAKKGSDGAQCDASAKCTLQYLPNYHNSDFSGQCESEEANLPQANRDDAKTACIARDCDLASAGARYVTFRIDNDAGSVDCEPMVVNESYPGLVAYIRQIVEGNSARNAIYGFNFEPCPERSPRKSKKNQYEILYPSVIENLLNKMFSSSSLSPEDLVQISNFISILSRLNIKDLDAYFHMLRMRGVVLVDVVDSFKKQFWSLKNVNMSKKEVATFLKSVKNTVLFGDLKEARRRKAHSAMQLAKVLEEALQQAEQWAKELLGKKLTWSAGKTGNVPSSASQMAKVESKTETKPLVPILSKPNATPAQKEAAKKTGSTVGKLEDPPKPLVIKKETDPKFQQKKDDFSKETATTEEPTAKKDLLNKEPKESAIKKDSPFKPQVGADLKTAQKSPEKKVDSATLKHKSKKEKVTSQEKIGKHDETLRPSQAKTIRESVGSIGKRDEPITPKSQAKQEPTPIAPPTAISKKDETPTATKANALQQSKSTIKSEGATAQKTNPTPSSKEPSRATPQEPSAKKAKEKEKDKEAFPAFINIAADEGDAKHKKKVDGVAKPSDSKAAEQKTDYYKGEGVDPHTEAADKISTRSMRTAPVGDFRMRLAAALSAAQKYADKTLYVPDPHGVDDTPRGTKRFTTADVLETDGKALLRRSASKIYNDSSQLFERFSFLTTGAHQPGYYEPWDVELPWPDLQNLVMQMARFYAKRLPDPNFSYRRGMEYYQSIFRRELEEINKKQSKEPTVKKGK